MTSCHTLNLSTEFDITLTHSRGKAKTLSVSPRIFGNLHKICENAQECWNDLHTIYSHFHKTSERWSGVYGKHQKIAENGKKRFKNPKTFLWKSSEAYTRDSIPSPSRGKCKFFLAIIVTGDFALVVCRVI